MDEELKKLLSEYPEALQDKKRFKALLYDFFPMKRKEANALYMAHELGIPDNMLEQIKVTETDIIRYERQLRTNYGLDDKLIFYVLKIWTKALEVQTDNECFQIEEHAEIEDLQIVQKYKDIDNIYEMITKAVKEKYSFIKDNYGLTKKYFDEIICDLFRYDMKKAIEVWQWILNVYWKSEKNDEEASGTFLFSVLLKLKKEELSGFVTEMNSFPGIMKYIFGKGINIDYQQTELLYELLVQEKLDVFQQAWALLYENKKNHALSGDEVLEKVINNIRPIGGTLLSDATIGVLKTEVSRMDSEVLRSNTMKLLDKKMKDMKYFSQNERKNSRQNSGWDFAALKEKAVANRKDNPLWNGGRFISFTTVVGLYYRADKDKIIADMKEGDALTIEREPENEYDSMAVAVYDKEHRKMGYLPKESNTFMSTMMDAGQIFIARLFAFNKGRGTANIAIEIFIKQ